VNNLDMSQLRMWSGRLSLEEGTDFRGLNRAGGQLLLESNSRLGIQTRWNYLSERHDDDMVLGDVNLVYRFAQNEVVQFRSGLGMRVMHSGRGGRTLADRRQTDFGFNFTYGADLFPRKPWVLSGEFDAGSLGSAAVFHGRASAGVLLQRWEFFAGYDYQRIGSVDVQGPMVGLRFWF
jgi:hypothetical protein